MRDEKKAGLVFAAVLTAFVVVTRSCNQAAWHSGTKITAEASPQKTLPTYSLPPPIFADFVAVYGVPVSEKEGAQGKLHPPLAIKWLDYEPEHVRIAFVDSDAGEIPPRHEWIAISYIDSIENRPISAYDAGQRLLARKK